ncbi:MAG: VWA domain-containing protein [Planctomycetes bacterium]|nr:VWA domain-containing protein [Planctomycetota bacterium]
MTPPAQVPEEDDDDDDPRDTPPPTIYGEEIDTESDTIYYVIDISYSMMTDRQSYTTIDQTIGSGPRIDRAKAELIKSVRGLSDNFSFNVIAYDCSTTSWQSAMQEATDGNKNSAIAWVTALRPRGATGTGPAAALALAEKDNMAVVLLTDGSPNCGASGTAGHRAMIATANTQGASINVFGIAATGRYRAFCQAVAADSGGSYFDVP